MPVIDLDREGFDYEDAYYDMDLVDPKQMLLGTPTNILRFKRNTGAHEYREFDRLIRRHANDLNLMNRNMMRPMFSGSHWGPPQDDETYRLPSGRIYRDDAGGYSQFDLIGRPARGARAEVLPVEIADAKKYPARNYDSVQLTDTQAAVARESNMYLVLGEFYTRNNRPMVRGSIRYGMLPGGQPAAAPVGRDGFGNPDVVGDEL